MQMYTDIDTYIDIDIGGGGVEDVDVHVDGNVAIVLDAAAVSTVTAHTDEERIDAASGSERDRERDCCL